MGDIDVVEVGPRDGFQAVTEFIPTRRKIALIAALVEAGLRRIEVGSFVSATAIPQMADIREVLAALPAERQLRASTLVPNAKGAALALQAGVVNLVYVISASEAHNRSNVRRSIEQSLAELWSVLSSFPRGEGIFRLNIATAFDCPFTGTVADETVLHLVERVLELRTDIEIGFCDTTGRALPRHVGRLLQRCSATFGDATSLAFHGHDTYGFGMANVLMALDAGVRVIDASIAGLGGCPFAPGATGNVATEDVVYAAGRYGLATGIDLDKLVVAARSAATIPGAAPGGRVREAWCPSLPAA